MKLLVFGLSLISLALAASRKSAPPGALVVGKGQKFETISNAVAALSNTTIREQVIFIHPGNYAEQVFIPKLSGPLTVLGYTTDDSKWAKNQVTIVASESQTTQSNNDLTATLRVWTSDFKIYNVNIRNSFGEGSQAVAVSANAGASLPYTPCEFDTVHWHIFTEQQQGYYACGFFGYQDTLLAQSGAQLYAKSYIEGATDFIFGQRAQAWFEQCSIGVVAAETGWVTASGRSLNDSGWYVINRSRVAAAPGNDVKDGTYYLGRPWRNFARVVFQKTELSKVINQAGWAIWNVGDERTNQTSLAEFKNNGPGAKGERASFSQEIPSPIAIETVLGSGYASAKYVDKRFLK
jgi:pectinesterase